MLRLQLQVFFLSAVTLVLIETAVFAFKVEDDFVDDLRSSGSTRFSTVFGVETDLRTTPLEPEPPSPLSARVGANVDGRFFPPRSKGRAGGTHLKNRESVLSATKRKKRRRDECHVFSESRLQTACRKQKNMMRMKPMKAKVQRMMAMSTTKKRKNKVNEAPTWSDAPSSQPSTDPSPNPTSSPKTPSAVTQSLLPTIEAQRGGHPIGSPSSYPQSLTPSVGGGFEVSPETQLPLRPTPPTSKPENPTTEVDPTTNQPTMKVMPTPDKQRDYPTDRPSASVNVAPTPAGYNTNRPTSSTAVVPTPYRYPTDRPSAFVVGAPTPTGYPTNRPTAPVNIPIPPVVYPTNRPDAIPSPITPIPTLSVDIGMPPISIPSVTSSPTSFPETITTDLPASPISLYPTTEEPTTETIRPTLPLAPSTPSPLLVPSNSPSATPSILPVSLAVQGSPFSIVFVLPEGVAFMIDSPQDFVSAQTQVLEFYELFFQDFFANRDDSIMVGFNGEILESDPTVPSATFKVEVSFDPASIFIPTSAEIDLFAEIATFEEPFFSKFLTSLQSLGPDNVFSQTESLQFILRPELKAGDLALPGTRSSLRRIPLTPFVVAYSMEDEPTTKDKEQASQTTIAIIDEFFRNWFDGVLPSSYSRLVWKRSAGIEQIPSQIGYEASVEATEEILEQLSQEELDEILAGVFHGPVAGSVVKALKSLPDDNPFAAVDSVALTFEDNDMSINRARRRVSAIAVAAISLLIFSSIALMGSRMWPARKQSHPEKQEQAEQVLLGDTSNYSMGSSQAEKSTEGDFWDGISAGEHMITFATDDSDPLLWRSPGPID